MSIKSLFKNIADAIKIKNTDITEVTPADMPQAILSIPSGGAEMTTTTLYENPTYNTRPNATLDDSIFNYKLILFEFHRQYSNQSQVMTAIISVDGFRYYLNKITLPVTNLKLSAVAADGWILYNYVDDTHFNFEIASSNIVWLDRIVGIK